MRAGPMLLSSAAGGAMTAARTGNDRCDRLVPEKNGRDHIFLGLVILPRDSRYLGYSVVSPLSTAKPRNARNPIESVVIVTKIELATAGS